MPRRQRGIGFNNCNGRGCFEPHCDSCWGTVYHSWAPDQNPMTGGIPFVDPECVLCQQQAPPRPPAMRIYTGGPSVAEAYRQEGVVHSPRLVLATEYWDWSTGVARRRPSPREQDGDPRRHQGFDQAGGSDHEGLDRDQGSDEDQDTVQGLRAPQSPPARSAPRQAGATRKEMVIAALVNGLDERRVRRALIAAALNDKATRRDVVRHVAVQRRRGA